MALGYAWARMSVGIAHSAAHNCRLARFSATTRWYTRTCAHGMTQTPTNGATTGLHGAGRSPPNGPSREFIIAAQRAERLQQHCEKLAEVLHDSGDLSPEFEAELRFAPGVTDPEHEVTRLIGLLDRLRQEVGGLRVQVFWFNLFA